MGGLLQIFIVDCFYCYFVCYLVYYFVKNCHGLNQNGGWLILVMNLKLWFHSTHFYLNCLTITVLILVNCLFDLMKSFDLARHTRWLIWLSFRIKKVFALVSCYFQGYELNWATSSYFTQYDCFVKLCSLSKHSPFQIF